MGGTEFWGCQCLVSRASGHWEVGLPNCAEGFGCRLSPNRNNTPSLDRYPNGVEDFGCRHVSRRAAYGPPKQTSAEDLALVRRVDELYAERPCYGTRRMVAALRLEGIGAGCNRVHRLVRLMGVAA